MRSPLPESHRDDVCRNELPQPAGDGHHEGARHGDGTEYPEVVRQVAGVQGRPPAAGVLDALRVRTVASDACPSGDLCQQAAPGPDEQ